MYTIDIKQRINEYTNKRYITVLIENSKEIRGLEYREFYYYRNIKEAADLEIDLYIYRAVFEKEGLESGFFKLKENFDLLFIKRINGANIRKKETIINLLLIINKELIDGKFSQGFLEFFNKVVDSVVFEE